MEIQYTKPQDRWEAQAKKVIPFTNLSDLPESTQQQLAALHGKTGVNIVAVLYYGGTLGMVPNDRGDLVPCDNPDELLKPLKMKGLDKEVYVVWIPVYKLGIDSTNARWVHHQSIANVIKLVYDLVDGFAVAGGTDTKSHLLAALSYIFPNIGKPIIGVAAQVPIFKQGDDATNNIYFAICAAYANLSGVHSAFNYVLRRGLQVFKVQDRRYNAFDAPPSAIIGEFVDSNVELHGNHPRRNPLVTADRLEMVKGFMEAVKVVKISTVTPSESLDYDARDPNCAALLFLTFGAGNVRDEKIIDEEVTHVEILRQLHEEGIAVVLGSPMMDGRIDSAYRGGAEAIRAGAVSGGDTCGAALEVKISRCVFLAWDWDNQRLDYRRFREELYRNHAGELTMDLRELLEHQLAGE
ncbi:MAG: asparaginase domain-containing protein [Patescibacteria group bacterium]